MRLIDKDAIITFIKQNGLVYANTLEKFPEIEAAPHIRGEYINGCCSVCGSAEPTDSALDYIALYEKQYCYFCGAKIDVPVMVAEEEG